MKKKMIGLIATVIVAVVAVIKVNIDINRNGLSGMSWENVEVLAENESNPWYLWLFQGLTKDEEPRSAECSVYYGVPPYVVVVHGSKGLCDDGGHVNCTVGSCN